MTKKFTIEIRDYAPGYTPDRLTPQRVEQAIQGLVDRDGSDGTVIVKGE